MDLALDMRTIFMFGVLAAVLETAVLASLWQQSRARFRGIGLWLTSFTLRLVAMILIFFRDEIPDFLSIMVGNALLIIVALLLLSGLERFVGREPPRAVGAVLLVAFIGIHAYFTYIQPDLTARSINYAGASILVLGRAAWLMLVRAERDERQDTRSTGLVLTAISAILAFRIVANILGPRYQDLLQSGLVNASAILGEIVLWIGLAFTLVLMVNRRLVGNLEADIQQRLIAEESLRSSEEKFELAFRSVPDAIVVATFPGGRIIEVNGGFRELLGYDPDEVQGGFVQEFLPWVDPSAETAFLEGLAADGKVPHLHTTFRTKSGDTFPGIVSGELITLDGQVCVVGLIHDDSESQRAQDEMKHMNSELERRVVERTEELMATNEQLAEANRAKSDFLASMSHELRTPLNSIIGFSGILSQELAGPLNPEQKLQINMLNASGKHLLALVDDILDLAKIESGTVTVSPEQFEVEPLARAVVQMVEPLAQAKDLALSLDISAEVDVIETDPRLLSQILTNLLGNAIKFTDDGSVELSITVSGEGVLFAVTDTGRGIPEDSLPHLTEQFFQAEPIREAKNPGAGLGLTISSQLAGMLDARIDVSSEVGVGSTFTVWVPRSVAPETI